MCVSELKLGYGQALDAIKKTKHEYQKKVQGGKTELAALDAYKDQVPSRTSIAPPDTWDRMYRRKGCTKELKGPQTLYQPPTINATSRPQADVIKNDLKKLKREKEKIDDSSLNIDDDIKGEIVTISRSVNLFSTPRATRHPRPAAVYSPFLPFQSVAESQPTAHSHPHLQP